MRPNLVDNDFALAIERGPDSTPQVTILEAALASPPSLIKALDQVIVPTTKSSRVRSCH